MALEFSEYGKGIILRNLFGKKAFTANKIKPPLNVPTLSGINSPFRGALILHMFGGVRPNISTLPKSWQGTEYSSNAPKLYPNTSDFVPLNTGTVLSSAERVFVDPNTNWTINWTTQNIVTKASSVVKNMLLPTGTITWFAVYAGMGTDNPLNYMLAFTGSVGVTGSNSDIELNTNTVQSNNYPCEIKRLSFTYTQPTNVDLIFSKNIYTTALLNTMGSGISGSTTSESYYNFTSDSNAKYTSKGTNRVLLYSGTRPTSPDSPIPFGNTLIATIDTFPMVYDKFSTFTCTDSEISLAKTGTYIGTSSAVGTPTWARVLVSNTDTSVAFDCSAGLTDDSCIKLSNASTVIGQQINIISFKFSMV